MDWTADVNLSGTLASVGARLIEGTADKMIGQTFDCMRGQARGLRPADARLARMEHLSRVVGPVATNVHVLADPRTREAIAIDTATPSLAWIADELAARDWTLKLIVSTHGHWDHIGDNAAVAEHTGADIAVHPLDRERLTNPQPLCAPFEIPPSVPAVELAEGGVIRFGEIRLRVLHTPGHTEGSVCLLAEDEGLLFSGDTLFAGGWGRVDLPGGDPDAMVASLARLTGLEDQVGVFPGHGPRRRSGASEPGWSSSATAGGCSPDGRRPCARPGRRGSVALGDHRDRDQDRIAQPAGHVRPEPARDARRQGRQDDLVDLPTAHRVLDGEDRITIADLAVGLDAERPQPLERLVEPLLGDPRRFLLDVPGQPAADPGAAARRRGRASGRRRADR